MKSTIDNSFYKKGYRLALDNSKSLQKISQKAADEGEFGIACSLNVLAAEEAMKASIILLKNYQPQMDSKEFVSVFRNHKKKHSLAQVTTFLSNYLSDTLYKKYLENKKSFDLVESLPQPQRTEMKEKYKLFYKTVDWAIKQQTENNNFEKAFKWWEIADDQKKLGFYVDIVNEKWHNPRTIKKEKFLEEREYTLSLIEHIEAFNSSLLPMKLLRELARIKITSNKSIAASGLDGS